MPSCSMLNAQAAVYLYMSVVCAKQFVVCRNFGIPQTLFRTYITSGCDMLNGMATNGNNI